jgi:hypothetical protein
VWPFFSSSANPKHRPLRKEERFRTNLLSTDLGTVVDISGSGVRVRVFGRTGASIGQVVPLTIRSPQGKVTVHSRVVRVGKPAPGEGRGTDVCFTFLDATPALRNAIAYLGRFGFIPRLGFGDPVSAAGAARADGQTGRRRRRQLPDYYGVLGLTPDASADDIRHAYHQLARRYHPDHSRNTESVGVFEALAEAYKTLRDSAKRAEYDAACGADGRSAA